MVAVGSADPGTELEAIRSFADVRVDGILLAGYIGSPEELEAALRGTPAVVITREMEVDGVDSVLTDDFWFRSARGGAPARTGAQAHCPCGHLRLAAIHRPPGRLAAQVMLERLAGGSGPAVTRKLEPALMVRRSSKQARDSVVPLQIGEL